jgi:hypothetical protein
MSRLDEFFPAFTNAEVTDPDERARRLRERLQSRIPSQYVVDAERIRNDRVAFQIAIRRYDEQRATKPASTVKVVA